MNFKTTILLLVLVIGGGIYLAVAHIGKSGGQTEAVSTNATKLIDADSAEVTRIVVTPAGGKKLVLQKTSGAWRMLEPVNAPADEFNVDTLARQLTAIESRGHLSADKLAGSGLDHPSYTVELTAKGKTYKLAFGDRNEIGDTLYARLDDRGQIDIVPTSIYDELKKPAKTYRSTKLVDVTSDQVRQLAFTHGGQAVKLEKRAGEWQIVEPRTMLADPTAVSDLLFAVTGLTANEYVQGERTSQAYGLDHPVATVWFSSIGPTTQPTTAPATRPAGTEIKFGNYEDILKTSVYAQVGDGPVVTVPTTTIESFNKTPLDLRDKKVADIDPAHVASFTVAINRPATTQPTTRPAEQHEYTIARRTEPAPVLGPELPTTRPASTRPATTQPGATTQPAVAATQPAAKPASKWVFESGGNGDAEEGQVQALLDALHPLRADKYLQKLPTNKPAATAMLTVHVGPANGSGPRVETFRFFNPGPTGTVVATHGDLVFEVDRYIFDKLEGDFKTKKPAPPAPAPNFGATPPGGFNP